MAQASSIEAAIQQQLRELGTCSLDELTFLLSGYSWGQVFTAVDRLTRNGTVRLNQFARFRYNLSLIPERSAGTEHAKIPKCS
jgi:hypothetical protein